MWLLNTHSIHNYQFIKRLIPKTLLPRPPPVTDPAAVRANAVASMATKKQETQALKGKSKAPPTKPAQSAKGKQKVTTPQVSPTTMSGPSTSASMPGPAVSHALSSQIPHGLSFPLPSPILKRKSEDHPEEDMQPPKLRKPPAPRPRSKPVSHIPNRPSGSLLPHYGSQHPPPASAFQPQPPLPPSQPEADPHSSHTHTTDLSDSESPWPRWPPGPGESA